MRKENKISFIIAGGVAIVVLTLMLVLYFVIAEPAIWMLIVFPLVLFIVSFFSARLLINAYTHNNSTPFRYTPVSQDNDKSNNSVSVTGIDTPKKPDGKIKDIASQKISEQEELKSPETYRKEFLGNVYHELKTPIFNIQGYILTLIEGGLDDPGINSLYLERTERNINRMISVVDDLESISGLESGELNLKIERFNIKKIIREVFELNEMRAKKLNIKLEDGKSKAGSVIVKADKKRIFQVLNNLVMNSINYGIKNGQTVVSLKESKDRVFIEVKDNGIGINKDDLSRIFERFYRVDKSRSRDTGGTGLGLSIVKHIIEAHKQTVVVESAPGKGSSFTFTLDRV